MGRHSWVHRISGKHLCDPDLIGPLCKLLPSGRGQQASEQMLHLDSMEIPPMYWTASYNKCETNDPISYLFVISKSI